MIMKSPFQNGDFFEVIISSNESYIYIFIIKENIVYLRPLFNLEKMNSCKLEWCENPEDSSELISIYKYKYINTNIY